MEQKFIFVRPFITLFVLTIFLVPSAAVCQTATGSISGIVIDDETSNPLNGVTIIAFPSGSSDNPPQPVTTDGNGEYIFADLAAGNYNVQAHFYDQNYIPEYYDDSIYIDDAEEVAVTAGQNTSGIDFALAPGGMISGKVVDSDGAGIADIGIFAFTGCYGYILTHAVADAAGAYTLMGLPTGSFYLQADDLPFSNSGKWYPDAVDCEDATPVPVTIGSTTEDINFQWGLPDDTSGIPISTGYKVVQLTDNMYEDENPRINNNGYMVWYGYDGSDYEIFLYDGSTTSQLTENSYDDRSPQINDNGSIAWTGGSNIFIYDGQTTAKLTDNDGSLWSDDPQINNSGYVVWNSGDMENSQEIWLYDGSTATQLYYIGCCCDHPRINDDGQVVWTDSDIHLYGGASVEQLTTTEDWESNPEINNNGFAAWSGFGSGLLTIFVFDGSSVERLVDKGYDPNIMLFHPSPHINDSGHLVWQGNDGYDTDIFYAYPVSSDSSGTGDDDSDGGGGGCFLSNLF